MTINDYLSQVSIGFPFYGVHAPAPLGSVAISLDRDFFQSCESPSICEEIIICRRLARYDDAVNLILKNIEEHKDQDFMFLELAHNYYLKGDVSLGREALDQVNQQSSEIFAYLKVVLFDDYATGASELETLVTNPLLFLRVAKVSKPLIDDEAFLESLRHTSDARKILIILVAIEVGVLGRNGMEVICGEFGGLIEKSITSNHKFIDQLVKTLGLANTKQIFGEIDVEPACPDVVYSIFSQFPERQDLFNEGLINHSSGFLDIDRADVMRRVLLSDHLIRDRNTSDNGTRFYSLNLRGHNDFAAIEKRAVSLLQNYVRSNKPLKDFMSRSGCDLGQTDLWFDMSVTYGLSKINEHIHTAAVDEIYLATLVWYAHVPENIEDHEGNICISTGGLLSKTLSISPKCNDYVIFPPWFRHGTTPTDTLEPRVTFNFDLFARLVP